MTNPKRNCLENFKTSEQCTLLLAQTPITETVSCKRRDWLAKIIFANIRPIAKWTLFFIASSKVGSQKSAQPFVRSHCVT